MINPDGDSVSIISYFNGWDDEPDSLVETFVFGDYPNATLPVPLKGQAVTRILESLAGTDYHCTRDSLGHIRGYLQGKVFDKANNLITSGSIIISPFPVSVNCIDINYHPDCISIQQDGTYSAPLYAMKYNMGSIQVCSQIPLIGCVLNLSQGTLKIDSIQFTIHPDSIDEYDIHLKDNFSGVQQEIYTPAGILKIYPNPVTDHSFHYQVSIPVRSTRCFFELINIKGQVIWQTEIQNNTGILELPADIQEGLYHLKLSSREKAFCSSPLLLSR